MGTCLIPNCRKQTPSSEPFCVDHRDPPTLEQKYNAAMHNWTIDSNAKEAEIAALQSRLDAALNRAEIAEARLRNVIGWRENDWPEGFDRRTAELVAELASPAAETVAARRAGATK